MNKMFQKILYSIAFVIIWTAISNAQSFGFGCLGLSGFYGGYTQQVYKADGINELINQNYLSSSDEKIKLEKGTGFRIGANIFRADFNDVFITVKGFFQFLKEEHTINSQPLGVIQGTFQKKIQLSMNHWGVALDFGFPLFSIFDLKLVEGGVTFYNSEFVYNTLLNDVQQTEVKLEPEKTQISYYIGSGLIINLIPEYISIEGTAAYTLLGIDSLKNNNVIVIPSLVSAKRPIEKGGFAATVQLNVGFPL